MSWIRDKLTEIYLNDYGRPLAEYLGFAVKRIPKDLDIWEKELRKLKKVKNKQSKKKAIEYYWNLAYYTGKLVAYFFVIQELGLELKLTKTEKARIDKIIKKVGSANKGAIPQIRIKK